MRHMKKKTVSNCNKRKIFIYRMVIMASLCCFVLFLSQFFITGINGGDQGPATLSQSDSLGVKGVFCYDETIVYAPCQGQINVLLPEGERVARGQAAASLAAAATDLVDDEKVLPLPAEASGLVSYHFDGWEGAVTPDNLDYISVSDIVGSEQKNTVVDNLSFCPKGQAVYKTLNNQKPPLLMFAVPCESWAQEPELGSSLPLKVNGENTVGKLKSYSKKGAAYQLVFALPVEDKWFKSRLVNVVLDLDKL